MGFVGSRQCAAVAHRSEVCVRVAGNNKSQTFVNEKIVEKSRCVTNGV